MDGSTVGSFVALEDCIDVFEVMCGLATQALNQVSRQLRKLYELHKVTEPFQFSVALLVRNTYRDCAIKVRQASFVCSPMMRSAPSSIPASSAQATS